VQAYDPQGGYITVQKGFLFHKDLYIPVNAVQRTDAEGNVRLSLHKDDLADERYDNPPTGSAMSEDSAARTATVAATTTTTHTQQAPPAPRQVQATMRDDDTISVPVFEEELVVGKQREEMGRVHLHKDATQVHEQVGGTVRKERVVVDGVEEQHGGRSPRR